VATFTVRRDVRAPAAQVWAALTDWPAHGRWVALTTVRVTSAAPTGVGATFVARTHLAGVGFEDPMRVTEWQEPGPDQPGLCSVVKTGRVVRGGATFVVTGHGELCTVEWTEWVEVRALSRLPGADPVSALVGRRVFASVVERMAREVEGRAGR
jgi:hypothetical protein